MTAQLPNPFMTEPPALSSDTLAAIMAEIEQALDLPAFIVSPSQAYLEAVFEEAA